MDGGTQGGDGTPGSYPEDDAALLALMRAAPVLVGPLPRFDPAGAPGAPGPLFARWLRRALDDGVPEPHVMTLATAGADGTPAARVLMLRGIDTAGCAYDFASDAGSGKGRDLAANPRAALTWYWPAHGRQIRMTGPVAVLGADAAARDFRGRSPASRAAGFTGAMSRPLSGPQEYDAARRAAEALVAAEPDRVPDGHCVYRLSAEHAEFFQAAAGGSAGHVHAAFHVRLRYDRDGDGWRRTLLWP